MSHGWSAWSRYSHSLPGDYPVRPTILPVPNQRPVAIDLDASENIFGPSDATPVGRVPLVTDVYPATFVGAAHARLVVRPTSSIAAALVASQIETARRGESCCLLLHNRVVHGMRGEDGLEDGMEMTVLLEGIGRGRH